jgi:hypothetical protein
VKDGAFVEHATAEQIRQAQRGEDGYRIDLARLDAAVAELAEKLLHQFPECARYTKQQVNFWKDLAWHQTIGHARDWLAVHYTSFEPWEGMRAFVEKRPARHLELRRRAAAGESSEYVWGPSQRDCPGCGTRGMPLAFRFCGVCGGPLNSQERSGGLRKLDVELAPDEGRG